jgi:hypothetical protein
MREAHLYGICYKCNLWYKDANMIWYKNENATCICTSTLPTEPPKLKTTPSSPRKRENVAWSKGLARISASCFSIGTWMRCHTRFPEGNQMHLICVPGSSSTHMIDEMSVLS